MSTKSSQQLSWVPLAGKWSFSADGATYLAPDHPNLPHGFALASPRVRNGSVGVVVSLEQPIDGAARILFGFESKTGAYFTAGLGGHKLAYLLDQFVPGTGWQAIRGHGSEVNLSQNTPTSIRLDIMGQRAALSVSNIRIITETLPHPLLGDQVGVFAWGNAPVHFSEFAADANRPRAFVIMQFGDPYDAFYRDVIVPIADRVHLEAIRADDIYKPGIILNDIIRSIQEADIIIAEISPTNANVFYELGYAHALEKPAVLLAERKTVLPFDLSGQRCILYADSIAGKRDVEEALERHLRNILADWGYNP